MKLLALIATLLVANPLAAQELPDMPKPKTVVVRQADAWPPAPLYKAEAHRRTFAKVGEYFVYFAPIASSLAATYEGNECRKRNGVAPCSGGYGAFWGRELGVRLGASVVFSGLSMYGHKAGFKEWSVMGLGMTGFNTSVAIKQSLINVPKEKE